MKEKIKVTLVSKGEHLVINQLTGKKTVSNNKSLFWYVDKQFSDYMMMAGVKTKSKSVGVYDVVSEAGVSLKDVIETLPGSLSRKWLSQSQIVKVCKHFKKWLKFEGYTYFLAKIREDRPVDPLNPWKNLMVIEVEFDYEDDLAIRLFFSKSIEGKSFKKSDYRLIIPKRTKEVKE